MPSQSRFAGASSLTKIETANQRRDPNHWFENCLFTAIIFTMSRTIIFVVVGLCIFMPVGVYANVTGTSTLPGDASGEPLGSLNNIAILHETLTFDLSSLTHQEQSAHITAVYQLQNNGQQTTANLVFISPGIVRGKIFFDGTLVRSGKAEEIVIPSSYAPPSASPPFNEQDKAYPIHYTITENRSSGFQFQIAIPAGKHELKVSYDAEMASYGEVRPVIIYQIGYVLSPAKDWQSFGDLAIQVIFPDEWEISASLPLQKTKNMAAATFEGLPADTFAISIRKPINPIKIKVLDAMQYAGIPSALILGILFGMLFGRPFAAKKQSNPGKKILYGFLACLIAIIASLLLIPLWVFIMNHISSGEHLTAPFQYGHNLVAILISVYSSVLSCITAIITFIKIQR
jgi:hypothetical protein